MVKGFLAPVEKALVPVNNILRNDYVTAVVALFVVLYASNVAPRLPEVVMDLFNNPVFKVFVLFLVAFVANKNPAVALLVSIAFMVTLNMVNRQEAEEGFLDVIDSFADGPRKENFGSCGSPRRESEGFEGDSGCPSLSKCKDKWTQPEMGPGDCQTLNKCCECLPGDQTEGKCSDGKMTSEAVAESGCSDVEF